MKFTLKDITAYSNHLRSLIAEDERGVIYDLFCIGFDSTFYCIKAWKEIEEGKDYSTVSHMYGPYCGQLGTERPSRSREDKVTLQKELFAFFEWAQTIDNPLVLELKERIRETRNLETYSEMNVICRKP